MPRSPGHYRDRPGSSSPGPWRRWSVACSPRRGLVSAAEPGASASKPKVDFNREVRPILAKNCFACHGQDEAKRAKGLRLDVRESAIKPLKSGEAAIVPGDPDSSELIARLTEEDETLRMPPKKTGNRLAPAEVDILRRWIEQGGRVRPALGARSRPSRCPCRRSATGLAAQRHRLLDPPPAGSRGPEALARGRRLHAAPPRQPGPPRPAADPRGGRSLRPRPGPRRLRTGRRPLPRRSGLRRALGADLARPGPLCRLGRIRLRPAPARHLAISRLGHRRLQPQPALRPVHPRADRRRPAARPEPRGPDRHGVPPQHDDQHRGRHRRRGVPRRRDQGPRRHHDAGLDGADDRLRQVPQPQVRPDHAGGVLPLLRDLQPDRRRRSGRREPDRPAPDPGARRRRSARPTRRIAALKAKLGEDDPGRRGREAQGRDRGAWRRPDPRSRTCR